MSIQIDLTGKRALVCGASSGIGEACARRLSEAGAHVVLLARNADKLAALVGELGSASAVSADMDDLLATIFTVRGYVMVAMLIVGVATFATIALVFALSLQLRRREMETITKIGGAKMRIRGLVAMEILGVLGGGASLAAALSVLTHWFAPTFTRMLVLLSTG